MNQHGVLYRERLWPRPVGWLLPGGLVAMLALAYGAALGATVGWLVALVGSILAGGLIWVTTPTVMVDIDALRVDRAAIPRVVLGTPQPLTRADIQRLRGPGGDVTLFSAVRPWAATRGVLVPIEDPADPHPAWLISSRHPDRLAAALTESMRS